MLWSQSCGNSYQFTDNEVLADVGGEEASEYLLQTNQDSALQLVRQAAVFRSVLAAR